MKNLIHFIDTFFRKVRPEDAFKDFLNIKSLTAKYTLFDNPNKNYLRKNSYFNNLSNNELDNLFLYMNEGLLNSTVKKSLYNLLIHFTEKILEENNNQPECKHEYMLEWAEISRFLGEDLFTCSFFAYNDLKKNRTQKTFFAWKPIINSNNNKIREILKEGLAENHFHLGASAPNYLISWIYLMNNFFSITKGFDLKSRFDNLEKLEPEIVTSFNIPSFSLYELVKRAFYIRGLLYFNFIRKPKSIDEYKKLHFGEEVNILKKGILEAFSIEMQEQINILRKEYSLSFYIDGKKEYIDYTLHNELASENYNCNIFLCGERYFLYEIFKLIFSNNLNKNYQQLFYIYLLIKSKFRQELIQLNNYTGLKNFKDYNERKAKFIPKDTVYDKLINYMSIHSSNKHQNIKYFELRITPQETKQDYLDTLNKIDKDISIPAFEDKNYAPYKKFIYKMHGKEFISKKNYFFTIHFTKALDKIEKDEIIENEIIARHNLLRINLKELTLTIINIRKPINDNDLKLLLKESNRKFDILGIDVAGAEIGCRPEVFGQAFRVLKNTNFKNTPKLGFTYHVGEDFLDIVDGLRAIDEAIIFLNLNKGDRLGHALALGVDIDDFYKFKNYSVLIPKQDLLDNIVWLLANIQKYSIKNMVNLVEYLDKKYMLLFSEIYENYLEQNNNSIPSYLVYFNSWKLRGDNPYHYFDKVFNKNLRQNEWEDYSINSLLSDSDIRNNHEITTLYYHYHFDEKARVNGNKIEELNIERIYAKAVKKIQKEMQFTISKLGIAIETNPTSNYLIGTFKSYAKHPISNFFNLGLEKSCSKRKSCPQLSVSINTDDQGLFNTSLENEYYLMARALEKEIDENGNYLYKNEMIYDWLNRIRQMGLEQSFMLRQNIDK